MVDWNTFNIGSQAKVNFNQPSASAVILNRVMDANPSQILGQLSATGQVFVIFVMTMAAAEAAVGLAIIISIFRHKKSVNLQDINLLRG